MLTPPFESCAFVCCIEAGPLEAMAVRLLRSIRVSGGRFAGADFIAVIPRPGPSLREETVRGIRRERGQLVHATQGNRFPWTPFFGKPRALIAAERVTSARTICFLDTDTLVMSEPAELSLIDGEQFAACPAFDAAASSTGAGDANDAFWEFACARNGMGVHDLPLIRAAWTGQPIRLHFNAGVMVYDRASRFAEAWLKTFTRLLQSRIAHPAWGIHTADEVAAAIAVRRLGLSWRALPVSHNYSINSWTTNGYRPDSLREATILHYHTAMLPANWNRFLDALRAACPDTHDWLQIEGPVTEGTLYTRWHRTVLRGLRAMRRKWVLSRSRIVRSTISPSLREMSREGTL